MKKILSVMTSIALSLSMVGCSAENSDEWKNNVGEINLTDMTVSGNGISVDGNKITITDGGDFTVTGTLADGMIYVNAEEKVKLRLSGASITNSCGPAIFFDNTEEGLITLTENTENHLADGSESVEEEADAVIFSNDDIEIKGDGKLVIDANYKHGIAGDDDVKIENGDITITSYEHGIKVNDTLSVLGGNINITTETGKGMKAELEVIIDAGTILINSFDEGIESKGILAINGGDINITSAEDGLNTGNSSSETDLTTEPGELPRNGERPTPPEGMDGQQPPPMPEGMNGQQPPAKPEGMDGQQPPAMPEGMDGQQPPEPPEGFNGQQLQLPEGAEMPQNMPMPGGGREGMQGGGGGFGFVDEETAAAHAVTITGGNIYINAQGDGIDSNGNLTISGGNLVIDGPVMNGNGSLDAQGTMSITGGTVITTSNFGMMQLPRSDGNLNIASIMLNEKQTGGTKVSITDTDGNELINVTPQNEYQLVVLASASLETDKEYIINLNGQEYERFTAVSGTTSVGQQTGMFGGGGRGGMGGRGNRGGFGDRMQNRVKVKVNGNEIQFDTAPVVKNDTTLVGYRAIMEALGANVEWDDATQTVTAEKDGTKIVLVIGSDEADVNGEMHKLLLAPEIIGNSTMVPVRFISEQLGMNVGWDEAQNLVTVDSPQ